MTIIAPRVNDIIYDFEKFMVAIFLEEDLYKSVIWIVPSHLMRKYYLVW